MKTFTVSGELLRGKSPLVKFPRDYFPEENSSVGNSPVSFSQIIFDGKMFLHLKVSLLFQQVD